MDTERSSSFTRDIAGGNVFCYFIHVSVICRVIGE